MVVLAQLSTSVSDGQIRLIIVALLAVAVLLAALTTWYAIKTSPRKRVQAAQQARRGSDATLRPNAVAEPAPARPSATATTSGTRPVVHPVSLVDDDDDDEWTRLTAPQPPQQQRSTRN